MTTVLAVALAPVLVAYVVLCFRDPLTYALPPYAVAIPFSSLVGLGTGRFGSVSTLLGLLLGAALLVQLITNRRGNPRLTLAVPVWLAFLAVCGFSLFWSINARATVSDFLVLASLVLLFVALALTGFDAATLRRFETAVVLGGLLVVAYGLVALRHSLPAFSGTSTSRFGLFDPNNQAASLLLPVAIAAGRLMTGRLTRRLLYAAVTTWLLVGILLTGSRGGLIAVFVVLAVSLLMGPARRATKVLLSVSAVVLLTAVLVLDPGGIAKRQVSSTDSSGRTSIWTVALHSCPHYCLVGAGWGTFPTVYQENLESVPSAEVLPQGVAYQPHNILVLAIMEAGVLGLLLMVLGLGIALIEALRLPSSMRAPPVAAVLGTVASSMFLSNLGFKFFWAVLAYPVIAQAAAAAVRSRAGKGIEDLPSPVEPVESVAATRSLV